MKAALEINSEAPQQRHPAAGVGRKDQVPDRRTHLETEVRSVPPQPVEYAAKEILGTAWVP